MTSETDIVSAVGHGSGVPEMKGVGGNVNIKDGDGRKENNEMASGGGKARGGIPAIWKEDPSGRVEKLGDNLVLGHDEGGSDAVSDFCQRLYSMCSLFASGCGLCCGRVCRRPWREVLWPCDGWPRGFPPLARTYEATRGHCGAFCLSFRNQWQTS